MTIDYNILQNIPHNIPHVYAIAEENNKIFVLGGELEDKVYNDIVPRDINYDEMSTPLSYIQVIRHTNRDPENILYLVKVDKESGEIVSKKTIDAMPSLTFKQGLTNLLNFGTLDDPSRKIIKSSRENFFKQLGKYESDKEK